MVTTGSNAERLMGLLLLPFKSSLTRSLLQVELALLLPALQFFDVVLFAS